MALFATKQVPPKGLEGFVRVENTEKFIKLFDWLYESQSEVLYNHSRVYPFSYLNKGRLKLYVNEDFYYNDIEAKIIPVVQKNEHTPSFFIHCPCAPYFAINRVLGALDQISVNPVTITDLTSSCADLLKMTPSFSEWKKVKTSDDVIQDTTILTKLVGRDYSSLRNTLKHVRVDLKPQIFPLTHTTKQDAIRVFEEWKDTQGKKYFRVTIGRDIRLIDEYCDRVDFTNIFGFVYYVDQRAVAVSFGCRSAKDPTWGMDVTCKALIDFKGMADFAFIHLMQDMNRQGILFVNDSGYYSPSIRKNKLKFAPIKIIPQFDLRRS